jgi:hypothetical protein
MSRRIGIAGLAGFAALGLLAGCKGRTETSAPAGGATTAAISRATAPAPKPAVPATALRPPSRTPGTLRPGNPVGEELVRARLRDIDREIAGIVQQLLGAETAALAGEPKAKELYAQWVAARHAYEQRLTDVPGIRDLQAQSAELHRAPTEANAAERLEISGKLAEAEIKARYNDRELGALYDRITGTRREFDAAVRKTPETIALQGKVDELVAEKRRLLVE